MAQEKIWAVSIYYGELDYERCVLYRNKEDAYNDIFHRVLRDYIDFTNPDFFGYEFGRSIVKYAHGKDYNGDEWMQFSIETGESENIYDAREEPLF